MYSCFGSLDWLSANEMYSDSTWIDFVRNFQKLRFEEIETYSFLLLKNDVSRFCYSCGDQREEVRGSERRRNRMSRDDDGEISVVERWTSRGKVENEYEIFLDLDEIWDVTLIGCANANEYAKSDVQEERKSDDVLRLRENELCEKWMFGESSRHGEVVYDRVS